MAMRIYGYPGERVDFVSASGSAGSIFFGDKERTVEEFFGSPHTQTSGLYTYFSGSIALSFEDGKVADIIITPSASKERIEVYVGKQKISGLSAKELEEAASGPGVAVTVEQKPVEASADGADPEALNALEIATVTFSA